MQQLPLFNFSWFSDFRQSLSDLAFITMKDEWDYKSNPTGGHPILFNYIHHTFSKLQTEDKLGIENDYALFLIPG